MKRWTVQLRPDLRSPRELFQSEFALRAHEARFARALLERRTNIWLFRCNQRGFCGDFVAVDMSAREPSRRRAYPIELKQRVSFKIGTRHHQLSNHRWALCEIAAMTAAIADDSDAVTLVGQPADVSRYLSGASR